MILKMIAPPELYVPFQSMNHLSCGELLKAIPENDCPSCTLLARLCPKG